MLKNVVLKKILKNTIFRIFTVVNKFISKDERIILLYSPSLGIRHSLIPLRKYLLDNNYNKNHKIYCGIENMSYKDNEDRVIFIGKLHSILMFFKAKYVFYSNGQIPIKPSPSQMVINLGHGNAGFKTMGALSNINNGDEMYFTKIIAPSDFFAPILAKEYNCLMDSVSIEGEPLNDQLLSYPQNVYDFSKYKKLLVWLPTFRQSEGLGYNDSSLSTLIPIFDENDYDELNDLLAKYNIRMIVKLHTAQDCSSTGRRHFSHLSVYSHEEFIRSEYELYTLVVHSNGLVGDYSSISLQYLVLDRPQAYVIPDIDEYKKTRGFVFDNPEEFMAGHIIRSKNEFYKFINDFAHDVDPYKEKRNKVCNIVYKYKDANTCKRIIDLCNIKK